MHEKLDTLRCWLEKIKHEFDAVPLRQKLTRCRIIRQVNKVLCAE